MAVMIWRGHHIIAQDNRWIEWQWWYKEGTTLLHRTTDELNGSDDMKRAPYYYTEQQMNWSDDMKRAPYYYTGQQMNWMAVMIWRGHHIITQDNRWIERQWWYEEGTILLHRTTNELKWWYEEGTILLHRTTDELNGSDDMKRAPYYYTGQQMNWMAVMIWRGHHIITQDNRWIEWQWWYEEGTILLHRTTDEFNGVMIWRGHHIITQDNRWIEWQWWYEEGSILLHRTTDELNGSDDMKRAPYYYTGQQMNWMTVMIWRGHHIITQDNRWIEWQWWYEEGTILLHRTTDELNGSDDMKRAPYYYTGKQMNWMAVIIWRGHHIITMDNIWIERQWWYEVGTILLHRTTDELNGSDDMKRAPYYYTGQ